MWGDGPLISYKMHFIRGGSTAADPVKRYVGRCDDPLCAETVDALERLRQACEYPRVEMVVTSPLRRCVQTADLLYPDTYTEELDGLLDMDLGRFEGKTLEELQGDKDFEAWLKNSYENPPPEGEHLEDFTKRIVLAVSDLFSRMMEDRINSVAVVVDGGVIMTLLAGIGLPKQPVGMWGCEEGCGYTVLFTPQMWMRDRSAEVYAQLPYPLDS